MKVFTGKQKEETPYTMPKFLHISYLDQA